MTQMTPAVLRAIFLTACAALFSLPAAAQQQWNEPLPPPVIDEQADGPTEGELLERLQELEEGVEAQQPNEPLPPPVEQEEQAQHNDPLPPPVLEDGEVDPGELGTREQQQ